MGKNNHGHSCRPTVYQLKFSKIKLKSSKIQSPKLRNEFAILYNFQKLSEIKVNFNIVYLIFST